MKKIIYLSLFAFSSVSFSAIQLPLDFEDEDIPNLNVYEALHIGYICGIHKHKAVLKGDNQFEVGAGEGATMSKQAKFICRKNKQIIEYAKSKYSKVMVDANTTLMHMPSDNIFIDISETIVFPRNLKNISEKLGMKEENIDTCIRDNTEENPLGRKCKEFLNELKKIPLNSVFQR